MKILRIRLLVVAVLLLSIAMQSCKTKKLATKPTPPPVEKTETPAPAKEPEKAPVEEAKPAPVEEKPNFKFNNVQFEFNSDVLKTASFEILDQVVRELKKAPDAKLIINGHSSAEGSVEHNMSLSVDRANSVKSYLINAGLNGKNLTTKGHGATEPLTSNATEEGKVLNRRVQFEVKP